MASTYLTYTQQSPSTAEGQKFTLSMWVKKCENGTFQGLWGNTYSNIHRGYIYFTNGDYLSFYDSSGIHVQTNRKFRDTNSFYHIVISADTTQVTASDRIKFYINGVQETSFSTATYPNQNDGMKLMNTTNTPTMGKYVEAGTSYYLQGAISHAHLTQGYVYDATAFGETDATTGEWKGKTSPSVTYGTNGFFILKDGNGITDQSGEGNDFTLGGGTLTDLKDNPDNVFATISRTVKSYQGSLNLSNGNNTYTAGNNWNYQPSTIGVNSGKYYWEQKLVDINSNGGFGLVSQQFTTSNLESISTGYSETTGVIMYWHDGTRYLNGNNASFGSAIADGDIMGCALDLDSGTKTITFYKNNTSQGTINLPTNMQSDFVFPCYMGNASSNPFIVNTNFGNGYFGTTAITTNSGNGYPGAEGSSKFNYTVPTGYSALSTKGLNE